MISIIMPSFNQATFIERAIDSIIKQKNCEFELIIYDGGSTDGTLDILQGLSEQSRVIQWFTEADSGPAEALNKCLLRSRGTIIGWLNSDDCYCPNSFKEVLQYFSNNPSMIMVYGTGQFIDSHGSTLLEYPTQKPEVGIQGFKAGCFICQPTVFFKRSMYAILGPLNENYKASFDYEFWLRAFSNFPNRIGFIDKTIAQSRLHNQTITHLQRKTIALEGARLSTQYFNDTPLHWLLTYIEEVELELKIPFLDFPPNYQEEILSSFIKYYKIDDIDDIRRLISLS